MTTQNDNTMHCQIVCLFPEIFDALHHGIPAQAKKKNLFDYQCFNPRDYTDNPHRTVDDKSYGGGPGMVMMAEPLNRAIDAAKNARPAYGPTILLSPHGRRLSQDDVKRFSQQDNLTLITARYEGLDERLIQPHIDEVVSLGDFILSGGEIAALTLLDAIVRLLPGALSNAESAEQESFTTPILDHPHYTRPAQWAGENIPEPLKNGNHKDILAWRSQHALLKTWLHRPDLLKNYAKCGRMSEKEKKMLTEAIKAFIM